MGGGEGGKLELETSRKSADQRRETAGGQVGVEGTLQESTEVN